MTHRESLPPLLRPFMRSNQQPHCCSFARASACFFWAYLFWGGTFKLFSRKKKSSKKKKKKERGKRKSRKVKNSPPPTGGPPMIAPAAGRPRPPDPFPPRWYTNFIHIHDLLYTLYLRTASALRMKTENRKTENRMAGAPQRTTRKPEIKPL